MNTTPPPGWYPDNHGGGQRYWDGQQWTQHTAPGIREPHDGQQPGLPMAPVASPNSVLQTNWIVRHKVISGLAAFVLIAAVGGALAGEDDSPVAAASETTAEAPDISSPDVTPIAEAEPVDSDGDGVADQDDFDPGWTGGHR